MKRFEIKIKRLSDQSWEWIYLESKWIVAKGNATSENFAFCQATKAIMQQHKYRDEIGLLLQERQNHDPTP